MSQGMGSGTVVTVAGQDSFSVTLQGVTGGGVAAIIAGIEVDDSGVA